MKDSIIRFLVKPLLTLNRPYAETKSRLWLFRMGLENPRIDTEEYLELYISKYSECIFEGLIGRLLLRMARVYGLTKKDMVEAFREGFADRSHSELNE